MFIDGHYLEGSLTYVVGVIQVRKPTHPCTFMQRSPDVAPLSDAVLQHAPHRLPLLERPPPLPRPHFPIPLPESRLPLVVPGGSSGHAAAAHLAGAVLPLPPGDLRPHVLPDVPCPYLGFGSGAAVGLPRLDRPLLSPR